ncbi:tetratricopeptide repeat protein [Marinoscillum pacificum]|uniref:tetratricopeptide repeat protein n=1 Tax=Marinoscillum pacificum TaxID=392723 RepID=UPI00215885B6|nr:hypothetical protein [Marinoscillum pacificum]
MKEQISRFIIALFIGATILLLYRYHRGYDDSIAYNVTTSAESTEFAAYPFSKGPFQFSFKGDTYSLAEVFAAGPITRDINAETGILILILIGLALTLSVVTTLSRTFFIGVMALFILFIIGLKLQDIGFFGFDSESSFASIVVMALIVLPSYLFHAFFPEVKTLIRFLTFSIVIAGIVLFSGVSQQELVDQFTVGSNFGLIIIGILFLFFIAEENVFAILYLITKSKGGKNNHIHFVVFSLVYLGILGLYYGKKSGSISTEVAFFDPFVLLVVSGLVALWSYGHKVDLYKNLFSSEEMRNLIAALGIITFGFLSLAMYRGNDAIYEGFHYVIVYAHLAFGIFFLIYVLINLLTPLVSGLEVYKVVYKSQNFPYASARLAGMVGVAAFFFLANKEPLLLFKAGQYNYLGAQSEAKGEDLLAVGYYDEGTVFGHDNHFSNYKLAYRELQKGDFQEANFRFGRAALRYPSPQAYINKSSTYALMSEATPSLVALKEGLKDFPKNPQLQNNLGLTYIDQDKINEAVELLSDNSLSGEWTNANLVNLWKIKPTTESAEEDFDRGNVAVKANVLNNLLKSGNQSNISFDTASLYPSYPLHRLAYLINASWYFTNEEIPREIERTLANPVNETVFWKAKWAAALSLYGQGKINDALRTIDQLIPESTEDQKARLFNHMGLIALSQHSIEEALRFFEKAVAEGSQAALLNKQASLLEIANFEEAANWSEYLVSIDSSYQGLQQDLSAIETPSGLSEDLQKMRLYYYYKQYSLAEISVLLKDAPDTYVQSMWAKVAKETISTGDIETYLHYKGVFDSYLEKEFFTEPELVLALLNNKQVPASDHPVSQIVLSGDTSKIHELVNIANLNAYNEPLVLGIVNYAESRDLNTAYQILVEAIDINKTNVVYRKRYVMAAIKSGLNNYANDMLNELKTMISPSEHQQLINTASALKETLAESAW